MMPSSTASRSRHYSGMDYASDTEALQSPVLSVRGMRSGIPGGRSHGHRTNSLPRTFQREALLRHPELSMEMDRLASPSSGIPGLGLGPDDPMSDSGIISAPENMLSIRNKRGKKIFFSIFQILIYRFLDKVFLHFFFFAKIWHKMKKNFVWKIMDP